jgi:hypothetical protein
VALAEKRGLKLTTGLVYNIRSASNAALRGGRTRLAQKPTTPKWRSGIPDDTAEAQLRAAIAQIGLARARQILEEVEETFAGR